MTRRRPKVVAFSRDYRRPPRWNMGLPPRTLQRRPHGPLSGPAIKIVLGAIGLLILIGPTGDFLNGWAKASTACRVSSVIDGDTVRISCPGRAMPSGRILGYDTPELFSPRCVSEFWRAVGSTFALRWLLLQAGGISVVAQGRDRYDRALVRLRVDGQDIARPMIAGGWGRSYSGGPRGSWC